MKILFALIIDALVLAALSLGVMYGDERLLNIGHFFGWFVGTVSLLVFISKGATQSMEKKYQHQCLMFRIYDIATDLLFVMFCAYQGWMFLAAIYSIAAMLKTEFKYRMEMKLCKK